MATMTKTTDGAWTRSTRRKAEASDLASAFLRLAMGAGLLSAVADRLGFWGPPGTALVSWGNFHNFLLYTAKLSPWCPAACIPLLGVLVTVAEAGLGILLVLGFFTRVSALLTGLLTLGFALAMTFVLGVHAPMNYSVFVFSAASFLLASQPTDKLSIDKLRELRSGMKN
jgi:uncharacterized membrane protein YphA (DoxX/SURF4 family)